MTRLAAAFACILIAACQPPADEKPADLVLVNGEFWTSNTRAPYAKAVAIRNDRFVYVGNNDGAEAFVSANTAVHDLGGRMVLPGIVDAHTHPGMVGISVGQVMFDWTYDRDELLRFIEEMIADNPERDFILGGYWSLQIYGATGPHRRDLDRIESERPVVLYDEWGHSVWANSKALEIAGIDENTPDITPGFSIYKRDENGELTGWVKESAASVLVNHFLSVTPEKEQYILEFLTYLRDLGVTTLLDAGNFGLDEETYAAISRLDKAGKLPVRYHGVYTLFLPDDYDSAVETLKNLNDTYGSDMLRIDTLKVFNDGVIETRTAHMFDDYLDDPGNSGQSLLSEQQLHDLIVELSEAGFNLHIHSVGDRSTNNILNAVEQAHTTLGGPPPIRIAICHLEAVLDSDFPRFKELGVIASFTPQWHGDNGEDYSGVIGDYDVNWMRPQPMVSDGAKVTYSSDITHYSEWDSDAANPFLGMQVGHNRQFVDGGKDALVRKPVSDRLAIDSLLQGYTIDAAYQLGRSDELGSIEPGKTADLVVLDRNLFDVDRYDIHRVKPDAVIMDGQLVHGVFE